MSRNVSKRDAEKVLREVAKWLATQGYGIPVPCGKCAYCRDYDVNGEKYTLSKGEYCDNPRMDPAPTGPAAAYRGLGPELVMELDYCGGPRPAIVLEGGPYDWAVDCAEVVQAACPKVFLEPVSGWALGIYRNEG